MLTYPQWRKRRERWRMAGFIAAYLVGVPLACLAVAGLLSLNCATVTDPPPGWPKDPTCAQDPNGPTCYPPIHDEKRDR